MNLIHAQEFKARRAAFMAQMEPRSVALFPAASEVTRSRDTEFPFRQNSDFYYLTGFNEPDAVLVLTPGQTHQATLFCRAKDKIAEIWQGRRLGPEQAEQTLEVDRALALDELAKELIALLNGKETLYFSQGEFPDFEQQVFDSLHQLRNASKRGFSAPHIIRDSRKILHEQRLFKSATEVKVMKQACEISAEAHKRAMRFAQPGVTEYQLEAELHHHFAMAGARYPAYGTIVGGGDNANTLHYTANSDALNDGDLVLIDSGCELDGYAADITRTFPVNGQFSAPQKALYELVLAAQLAALELIVPGNTLKMAADKAIEVLTQGLIDLGLLAGELQELIKSEAYKAFYMHGLGHWLGLDVHDVGDYKQDEKDRVLEPGMVLTVEPGLYVSQDAEVAPQYQGIGIRIEDDVLITEKGHEILTSAVPKTVSEIEALMKKANEENKAS